MNEYSSFSRWNEYPQAVHLADQSEEVAGFNYFVKVIYPGII